MALAVVLAGAPQGDPVVEQAVVADLGRLADDDAHAVVDEQPFSDLCTGVNLDAGLVPCPLGYDAGNGEPFMLIEPVGTPVAADCFQTGIGQQNLQTAACGRVLLFDNGNIFPKLSKHLPMSPPKIVGTCRG